MDKEHLVITRNKEIVNDYYCLDFKYTFIDLEHVKAYYIDKKKRKIWT